MALAIIVGSFALVHWLFGDYICFGGCDGDRLDFWLSR